MITEKITKNQIEKWKSLYENYNGKLESNRKSGAEIDEYFKGKYAYKSINSEKFKAIVEYNILNNDFSREKLKGKKPNVNCYAVGEIYVGIDTVSGEFHVECEDIQKASAIYDDLFLFRGLDETDLKNYVLVGQYIELYKINLK